MSAALKTAPRADTFYVRAATSPSLNALAELTVVTLREPARTLDGRTIPAGATGAIVAVWDGGSSYEVEFAEPLGTLATVRHEDLCLAETAG